jgi:hypothetical protein
MKEDLLERLRELSLVDVETLVARLDAPVAAEVLGAYVADLEDALGQARASIRAAHTELGSGPDPLLLLDVGSERRSGMGEPGITESQERLGARARRRRELAQLEELVRLVLPRLLEADRRYLAT